MKAIKTMLLAAALTFGMSAWAQAPAPQHGQPAPNHHEKVERHKVAPKKTHKRQVTVITGNVRLRQSASKNAHSVRNSRGQRIILPRGARLTVIGSMGNYYKVSYNRHIGYISKRYVR